MMTVEGAKHGETVKGALTVTVRIHGQFRRYPFIL